MDIENTRWRRGIRWEKEFARKDIKKNWRDVEHHLAIKLYDLFGIVVAVAVQSTFRIEMHQNDVFLFF
jgi:adenosylcobinamide amidohydrolase